MGYSGSTQGDGQRQTPQCSPQGKSTHLPTQRWAHILSPAHPARRSASGSMNAWFSHVCCLCYILPVLAFHFHDAKFPGKHWGLCLGPKDGQQSSSVCPQPTSALLSAQEDAVGSSFCLLLSLGSFRSRAGNSPGVPRHP